MAKVSHSGGASQQVLNNTFAKANNKEEAEALYNILVMER